MCFVSQAAEVVCCFSYGGLSSKYCSILWSHTISWRKKYLRPLSLEEVVDFKVCRDCELPWCEGGEIISVSGQIR